MIANLADPNAARDHARAMGGTVVEAMPVLPPVADDLPGAASGGRPAVGRDDRRRRLRHAAAGARCPPAADRPQGRRLRLAPALQCRNADRAAQHRRYGQGPMGCVSCRWQPAAFGHGPRPHELSRRRRRHPRQPSVARRTLPPTPRNTAMGPTAVRLPAAATACCSASPTMVSSGATSIRASICSRAPGSRRTVGSYRRSGRSRPAADADPARRDGPDRSDRQLPARPRSAQGLDGDAASRDRLAGPRHPRRRSRPHRNARKACAPSSDTSKTISVAEKEKSPNER